MLSVSKTDSHFAVKLLMPVSIIVRNLVLAQKPVTITLVLFHDAFFKAKDINYASLPAPTLQLRGQSSRPTYQTGSIQVTQSTPCEDFLPSHPFPENMVLQQQQVVSEAQLSKTQPYLVG